MGYFPKSSLPKFIDRMVQIQRSANMVSMGCTWAYCPLTTLFVSGSRCAVISINFSTP